MRPMILPPHRVLEFLTSIAAVRDVDNMDDSNPDARSLEAYRLNTYVICNRLDTLPLCQKYCRHGSRGGFIHGKVHGTGALT